MTHSRLYNLPVHKVIIDLRVRQWSIHSRLYNLQIRFLVVEQSNSYTLTITKSIGTDEKLRPTMMRMRHSSLYQSLTEERKKLQYQAKRAAALHSNNMNLSLEN